MSVMRRRALSIGVLLVLAAACPAAAPFALAQDGQRPRDTVVIKSQPATPATPQTAKPAQPTPGQPVLRKPLRTATIAAPRSGPTPLSPVQPLVVAQSDIKAGVAPLKGLNGPSASAQAAQCRAQCAKARYICTAQGAGDCDTVWGQCVVHCSGANYTETPDLASSTANRPGP
jgi:hypothetical protein